MLKCPCCRKQYEVFNPFGVVQRNNAQCPNCKSLERHRLIWLYLKQCTDFFDKQLKMLHVAPEKVFRERIQEMGNVEYLSIDISDDSAMRRMDLTCLDFNAAEFDVILCSHVLEHIQDDIKAMREMYRVLDYGGWAIIQVPLNKNAEKTFEDVEITDPDEREKKFGQKDHVRVYGIDYSERLKSVGFTVNVDEFISEMKTKQIKENALLPGEDIYYCTK